MDRISINKVARFLAIVVFAFGSVASSQTKGDESGFKLNRIWQTHWGPRGQDDSLVIMLYWGDQYFGVLQAFSVNSGEQVFDKLTGFTWMVLVDIDRDGKEDLLFKEYRGAVGGSMVSAYSMTKGKVLSAGKYFPLISNITRQIGKKRTKEKEGSNLFQSVTIGGRRTLTELWPYFDRSRNSLDKRF